nr:hypothetical protein [Opitutae bacterium KCR 482]
MVAEEGGGNQASSPDSWGESSRGGNGKPDDWRVVCELVAWICANSPLKWDDVLELSPLRLRHISKAIARRRARNTAATFDANLAANGDENALSRINKDLRAAED